MKLDRLSYGTVFRYRKRLFVVSRGLEGTIVTDVNSGTWQFVRDLNWKTFHICWQPELD